MRFVALLALLALGCTTWTHPSKGQRAYNSDDVICRREMEAAPGKYWDRYRVYRRCMGERGWTER